MKDGPHYETIKIFKICSCLTPYQRRTLDKFEIDALKLNEEDKDTRPDCCPYCKKRTAMMKRGFKAG